MGAGCLFSPEDTAQKGSPSCALADFLLPCLPTPLEWVSQSRWPRRPNKEPSEEPSPGNHPGAPAHTCTQVHDSRVSRALRAAQWAQAPDGKGRSGAGAPPQRWRTAAARTPCIQLEEAGDPQPRQAVSVRQQTEPQGVGSPPGLQPSWSPCREALPRGPQV